MGKFKDVCIPERTEANTEEISKYIRKIISLIGEDPDREGLLDTPKRVAKMYNEIFKGYSTDCAELLSATFNENYDELVALSHIKYFSMCEHHMVPFYGQVHIGYIANNKIVGLSKLARLVDALSSKLQVQERLTTEIADMIERHLKPLGVMVIVEGEHLCMCARGVKKPGVVTTTSVSRGVFKTDSDRKNEFLHYIRRD
ncbi:GTP cyclohydrolase I FolE [Paenibacillus sp. FSL H8-0122]|uniref:GTP cyclohydrolase I FolE n=1 Tax=Paenibacillus sp. FSL H8-0122 TaxID=2954510 RepID=UPI0030F64745